MTLLDTIIIKTLEENVLLKKNRKIKGLISTDYLPKFEHIDAKTIDEAILLLRTFGQKAAIIAGGTDLLHELKCRVHPTCPEVLVNIKSISNSTLNHIYEDNTGLKIGALSTLHNIEADESVKRKYSILAQAAHFAGGPQYRNMATTGGDLCQHVKCWYYRSSGNFFFCYRKGGDICYALNGDNRYHAVLGNKGCFAVCPSNTAPALVALNASIKIAGISGERIAPLEHFFTTWGNILKPDEIVTAIELPAPEANSRGIYMKYGLRNAFDAIIASVAAVVTVKDNLCSNARIVLGGVSPIPWRASKAEEILVGNRISKDKAEAAARATIEGGTPLRMNDYKLDLAQTLVKRAIMKCA